LSARPAAAFPAAVPARVDTSLGRGHLVRRALLAADVAGLAAAFLAVQILFGLGAGGTTAFNVRVAVLLFVFALPGWLAVAKLFELYDRDEERTLHSTVDDLQAVFHLVTTGVWVFYVGTLVTGAPNPNLPKLAAFWALTIAAITGGRAIARSACRRRPAWRQRTVIVGAGEVGQLVARKLRQHPEYGIDLLGFVDDHPREMRRDLGLIALLGASDRLPELVRSHRIERVVVAFSRDSTSDTVELVRQLKALDVQIDIVPRLYDVVGPNALVHDVEGLALLGLPAAKPFPFAAQIKRTFDIVGALIGLLLTAPLFALAAWRIRRESPGPVFFRQTRLGKDMTEFTLLKFRTMRTDVDQSVHRKYIAETMSANAQVGENGLYKLDRSDAITGFGGWLRKTSLDELPQLINVLRGEMSLVGPRPCLDYETAHFASHHFERFIVPQGITGLWQVTARAHASFGEALDMDVSYARNWSLGLDLWLIVRTPLEVLRRTGTA
jgi:exopolysaccharide biosynthesis polyprenyl glycosylphosphotransferase